MDLPFHRDHRLVSGPPSNPGGSDHGHRHAVPRTGSGVTRVWRERSLSVTVVDLGSARLVGISANDRLGVLCGHTRSPSETSRLSCIVAVCRELQHDCNDGR
jgi:hypothetical protein